MPWLSAVVIVLCSKTTRQACIYHLTFGWNHIWNCLPPLLTSKIGLMRCAVENCAWPLPPPLTLYTDNGDASSAEPTGVLNAKHQLCFFSERSLDQQMWVKGCRGQEVYQHVKLLTRMRVVVIGDEKGSRLAWSKQLWIYARFVSLPFSGLSPSVVEFVRC